MSLIHWWPLNGDTQDKIGGKHGTLTAGGNVNGSGKIGKCYSSTNNASNVASSADGISVPNFNLVGEVGSEYSFACWFLVHGTHGQYQSCIMSSGDWNQGNCWVIGFNSANTEICCPVDNYNTGKISIGYQLSNNVWYHLATVYKDGITTAYLNGEVVGTVSRTGIYRSYSNHSYIGRDQGHGGFFPFNGDINDLRIYDHALSQAEVKELSKALVMHYTFDDILAEPTTNESVLSNWSHYSSYWTSVETTATGWKLKKTSMSSSSTVAISNSVIYNKMAIGDIWTISCYLYKNDKPFKSPSTQFTNYLGTTPTLSYTAREDGYFSVTFRIDAKKNAYPIHAPIFGSDFTMDDVFEIRYLQVEKKEFATPYTVGTRNSMIYNETGLVQATNLNNVSLSNNSATGSYSLKCNNSWIYNETSSNGQQFLTMAAWVNPTDYSGDGIVIGGAYLCMNSSGKLYVYCYGRTPEQYFTGTTIIPTGQWTHIAVTWDDKDCTGYVNGVQEFKKSHPGIPNSSHHNKKDIGSEYGTRRFFNGLIDDVRIYNTCLSGNDIVELCKTKAYISDQGDIACGEFVEDKSTAQVTEKHCFQAAEIHEKSLNGYELLDYIEGNGTQYINLGIHVGNEMVVDAAITNPSGYIVTQYNYGLRTTGSTIVHFTQNQNLKVAGVIQTGVKVKVYLTNTSLVANGIVGTSAVDNDNPSGNVTIFAQGSSPAGSGRMHYCRLWKGDTLVRYLLPVKRLSDNAIGMYDAANNVLYTSATATALTAGPVITSTAMIYDTQEIAGRILNEI